jgi:pimeloyl-ACP methyl ester carboxylesterase
VPRLPGLSATLALIVVAAGLAGVAPPAAAGPAAAEPAAVPTITWSACDDGGFAPRRARCATVPVPLDYDDPTGPTVDLDLLRMSATTTDPAERLGTLFVNPGGPGAPARFFAADFGALVPAEVRRRFDIVGIDPRGVGASALAVCRNPQKPPRLLPRAFPETAREVRLRLALDRWERTACRDGGNRIVDHLTTADTARDMDLVREALGDARLTYYGISYGTQLGTTYAAMFPDNVRAMVLDGVLDPVQWSTGRPGDTGKPFSERLGSDDGAWESLTAAFAACDRAGPRRCAISGHARRVWRVVAHRLERRPFQGIHHSDLIASALGSLYRPGSIRRLMAQLGQLHAAMVHHRPLARSQRWRASTAERGGPGPYAPRGLVHAPGAPPHGALSDPFAAIACADSDNPDDPHAWARAARRADRTSHGFGSAWTWASSVCARWPSVTQEDRFVGPYDVTPSAPVLVVGNTHDPATPIRGARAVSRLLGGSRLLVLDGFGHGALGSGGCTAHAYADYLVSLALPAEGTVCRPARPLFPRR